MEGNKCSALSTGPPRLPGPLRQDIYTLRQRIPPQPAQRQAQIWKTGAHSNRYVYGYGLGNIPRTIQIKDGESVNSLGHDRAPFRIMRTLTGHVKLSMQEDVLGWEILAPGWLAGWLSLAWPILRAERRSSKDIPRLYRENQEIRRTADARTTRRRKKTRTALKELALACSRGKSNKEPRRGHCRPGTSKQCHHHERIAGGD